MSNVSPTIASTQIAAGSQAQALQGSTSGVLSAGLGGAANFFDLIISRLAAAEGGKETGTGTLTVNTGVTASVETAQAQAAPKAANPLALLQIALASQNVDADGNIVLTTDAKTPEKIQGQLDFTNQIINHLKTMLPEGAEQEGLFANILGKLQAKSDTLQASLSALENGVISKDTPVENIPMPLMIALGLKPSEINEVTQKIEDLEKKLGRDITVEDLIAGVGGLVPPAPETAVVAFSGSAVAKQTAQADLIEAATAEGAEPGDDLAAQLNALTVGGEEASADDASSSSFEKTMKGLPISDDTAAPKTPDAAVDVHTKKPATNIKDHMVNLLNTDKSAQGDMIFPVNLFNGDADAAIFQQYGVQPTSSLTLGATAQAANVIATSASAGQAHPATGMVAAQITRFAANGGDQTMNIRLDPPELGNVSVRLQIAKDKSVKAHLTIEKAETYMMLQRDAQALERALQQAGLEPGAEGVTFELAQDNGTFARDDSNNGAQDRNFGGGTSGAQDAGAGEIVQSSVMWQVDPSTGHVRYNLFA